MGEQKLAPLGVHALCELDVEPDVARVVAEVRQTGHRATHRAEARSPAGRIGRLRNWREPPPPEEPARTAPARWRLSLDRTWFTISRETDGRSETVARVPTSERRQIAETLIRLNVEVEGLPRHGGHSDGGFAAALAATIDEELARQRSRERP